MAKFTVAGWSTSKKPEPRKHPDVTVSSSIIIIDIITATIITTIIIFTV